MDDHIDRILLPRHTLARRVRELAAQITTDLRTECGPGQEPQITLIAVATGSLIFLADLIRELPLMMRIRLIAVTSYPGAATQSHGPRLVGDLPDDLHGRNILLIDDILDSGKTLEFVRELISQRHPATLRTCVLLRKQLPVADRPAADYVGFDIPNEFVVGYGLDHNGHYRNLPDVCILKPQYIAMD